MKNLFWVLLLGNVALYAVMRDSGLGWGEQDVQAQPALHSDMIRLIPALKSAPTKTAPALKPVPAHEPKPVSVLPASVPVSSMSAPSAKSNPAVPAATSAVVKLDAPVCLEWGDFSGTDLARAVAALSSMQLNGKWSRRQIEQDIGYWVYFPPLKNKAAVKRKLKEIKALGIKEYFVVQARGHWHNAISLGMFKTMDAAQSFLHGLNGRGVHTARVDMRAGKLKSTRFKLKEVDMVTVSKLTALQRNFPGSVLNKVPCTLTK